VQYKARVHDLEVQLSHMKDDNTKLKLRLQRATPKAANAVSAAEEDAAVVGDASVIEDDAY
jgi:hypothetical protein